MAAPGETDLDTLLATLSPRLGDQTYVFLSFHSLTDLALDEKTLLDAAVMVFREPEALTAVVELAWAVRRDLCTPDARSVSPSVQVAMACRMLQLQVHSSLDAVGMMAAVSGALAGAGLPCNAVAGFRHDYLFVPTGNAERAVAVLEGLQREASSRLV